MKKVVIVIIPILILNAQWTKEEIIKEIERLCKAQEIRYEAESNLFEHSIGKEIFDKKAFDAYIWQTEIGEKGWLQLGPKTLEPNEFLYPNDTMFYVASFRIKTDNDIKNSSPICTLYVFKNQRPFAKKVITQDSFKNSMSYQTFEIRFFRIKGEEESLSFNIYSCGTAHLQSDYVWVYDVLAESLFNREYDTRIKEMVSDMYGGILVLPREFKPAQQSARGYIRKHFLEHGIRIE